MSLDVSTAPGWACSQFKVLARLIRSGVLSDPCVYHAWYGVRADKILLAVHACVHYECGTVDRCGPK